MKLTSWKISLLKLLKSPTTQIKVTLYLTLINRFLEQKLLEQICHFLDLLLTNEDRMGFF